MASGNKHAVMVNVDLFVVGVSAHRTAMPMISNLISFLCVILLKVLEAVSVVHVWAVKQRCLLVVDKGIKADGAVFVASFHGYLFYTHPELIQFLFFTASSAHRKWLLFLLIEGALHIWKEGLKKLISGLYVLINRLVKEPGRFSLLLHKVMLLFVDETKLETNQALSHVFAIRPITTILHHCVEGIPSNETSSKGLDLNRDCDQVPFLSLNKRLWVIVPLSTYRAEALSDAFVPLEFLKVLKACSMVDMAAA